MSPAKVWQQKHLLYRLFTGLVFNAEVGTANDVEALEGTAAFTEDLIGDII